MTEAGVPYQADGLASLSLTIGAIVIVLWGGVWLLRRMQPGAGVWGARDCVVVRSLALGARERLVVVRVGTRHLVLGVGSAGVSLLCELAEPLLPAAPTDGKFGEVFRNAVERWRGR
jgi:flagellar protein FliO/FliZ